MFLIRKRIFEAVFSLKGIMSAVLSTTPGFCNERRQYAAGSPACGLRPSSVLPLVIALLAWS